jgi:hypothetical protein
LMRDGDRQGTRGDRQRHGQDERRAATECFFHRKLARQPTPIDRQRVAMHIIRRR